MTSAPPNDPNSRDRNDTGGTNQPGEAAPVSASRAVGSSGIGGGAGRSTGSGSSGASPSRGRRTTRSTRGSGTRTTGNTRGTGTPTTAAPRSIADVSFGRALAASVLSALVVAAVAHVVNALAYFVGGGSTFQVLAQVSAYFLWSSVFAFVLLVAFAALGGFRRWHNALIVGLVSGLVGAVLGTILTVTSGGQPLNSDVLSFAGASLVGVNLIFVLAYAVATPTLGRRVWNAMLAARSAEDERPRTALVRVPATTLAEG